MEVIYDTTVSDNVITRINATAATARETGGILFTMMVIHSTIASLGIITNFTVIVVFLNHKIFRKKTPNMFIINQVSIKLHNLKM